jgi:hypothetical protein
MNSRYNEMPSIEPRKELIISPKLKLEPRALSSEEIEQRNKILDQLSGSWTAEDEAAFIRFHHEMWIQVKSTS